MTLLWWLGCALHGRTLEVTYGTPEPVPLVHTSADRRRWYVPMESAEHGASVWFVDTGYDVSHCDDDFVAALGLSTHGSARIRGEIGSVRAARTVLPPLQVGGHTVHGVRCLVRDLATTSSIQDPAEVPVAGVLGMDVLREFRLVLDPANGHMELRDPSAHPPLPRRESTVAKLRSPWWTRRVKVDLQVHGRRVWPMIDTGATRTHVDGNRLALTPSARDQVVVRGTGGTGEVVRDVTYYRVANLHIGGQSAPAVRLLDRHRRWGAPAGLLGIDLLGFFRQDYDFGRRRVRFTRVRPTTLPQWAGWRRGDGAGAMSWLHEAPPEPPRVPGPTP